MKQQTIRSSNIVWIGSNLSILNGNLHIVVRAYSVQCLGNCSLLSEKKNPHREILLVLHGCRERTMTAPYAKETVPKLELATKKGLHERLLALLLFLISSRCPLRLLV